MADRVVGHADRVCVTAHFLAWCAAVVVWAVKWAQEGPAPSGPLYYGALTFISRVDALVSGLVRMFTAKVAPAASGWFSWDAGACLTIGFGALILAGGTVQWYLLGQLVRWVDRRKGRVAALSVLGLYGAWVAGALFLWIAS